MQFAASNVHVTPEQASARVALTLQADEQAYLGCQVLTEGHLLPKYNGHVHSVVDGVTALEPSQVTVLQLPDLSTDRSACISGVKPSKDKYA